jgi:hypothetical protein
MPVLPENTFIDANRGGFQFIYVGTSEQLEQIPSGMYTPDTGAVITTITTLTPAEVKNLATKQQTLIPAQGAGKGLKLIDCAFTLDYSGVAYTAGVLTVNYTDDSGAVISTALAFADLLDVEADAAAYTTALPSEPIALNAPIVLDATTAPLVGTSPIKVICTARVVEV